MEVSRRSTARNGVVAIGSVWESRMKSDEVKGGIKVFNGEETSESENNSTNNNADNNKKQRPKQSPTPSVVGASGKRKTWKSDNSENPIQIARQRSEQSKNLGDQLKELSVSADGIKKSPVLQSKKTRSEAGNERSPVQRTKNRSEEIKELSVSVDRIERNPIQTRNSIQLRKVKSESNKGLVESVDVNETNSVSLTKSKSLSNKVLDEPVKNLDGLGDVTESNSIEAKKEELEESVEVIEKSPVGDEKVRSDETCKELDLCEEKMISSTSTSLSNLGQVKSAPQLVVDDDDGDDDDGGGGDEENWDEELVDEEIEIEIEKKSVDVKEISIPEQKPKQAVKEEKKKQLVQENPLPISPIVKEINIPEQKPKQVVKEERKINQVQEKPLPISPIVKKQAPPIVQRSRTHPIPIKTKATPVSNEFFETHTEFQRIPETQSKLQSLVDLMMWRDVSKSAFVFGLGTFMIISSSYTQDLNISLITVVSYLGLVYLAAIFLFRSIIRRGVVDADDDTSQCYVVGEEEAVWLMKMVLPYLNEFLLKLRALFSGDPATTMKLAVLLFVLARCGSSITIWKMAKLGFFGVFTVPKIFTSYSPQLTAYGKFWVRRFKDAWESCSHKKAVAFGIFTLVWNLSSVVARIWAVFMLFVAFRYYQQSMMSDGDWVVEEEAKCETSSWQGQIGGGHRRVRGQTTVVLETTRKEREREKKRF